LGEEKNKRNVHPAPKGKKKKSRGNLIDPKDKRCDLSQEGEDKCP